MGFTRISTFKQNSEHFHCLFLLRRELQFEHVMHVAESRIVFLNIQREEKPMFLYVYGKRSYQFEAVPKREYIGVTYV